MKSKLLFFLILLITTTALTAQSKKELREDVAQLESELSQSQQELAEAKKNERISTTRAETLEGEIEELKQANATLLSNLKVFTEASKQRSNNISKTLEALREKEAQLNVLNETFQSNDSVALLILSDFKQTLGEEAKIGVETGAVTVRIDRSMLFGASGDNVTDGAQGFLSKIGAVMNRYPEMMATLVAMEDSTQTAPNTAARLKSIGKVMEETAGVESKRIQYAKLKSSAESYQVRIHPNFTAFYLRIRQSVKGS